MSGHRRGDAGADCLAVDLDRCTDEGLRECADVLYGTGCPARGGELLRRYPGCLLVTLRSAPGGGCRCPRPPGARPGRSWVAVVLRAGGRGFVTRAAFRPRALSASEHGALAARLHGLLVGAPRPEEAESSPWVRFRVWVHHEPSGRRSFRVRASYPRLVRRELARMALRFRRPTARAGTARPSFRSRTPMEG